MTEASGMPLERVQRPDAIPPRQERAPIGQLSRSTNIREVGISIRLLRVSPDIGVSGSQLPSR
jgi:hypothetical protein